MLRDMEDLLITVRNEDVKRYLHEALKCYNAGSYKACVIMSVIAGIYDLHIKVKSLASSDPNIRALDDEIERKKHQLEVYEKYLIEQCATEDIDMLNSNEAKELKRCLDTRNDCAHPSNFVCSPEKARDIYTSIIDILASKPILFGCRHMDKVIERLEEHSFFPVQEKSRMKFIVEESISSFHVKAIKPLLKLVFRNIIMPKSEVHKSNLIIYLALSLEYLQEDYEEITSLLIEKDQYENEMLDLITNNLEILIHLSDVSIDKILYKLKTNLKTSNFVNVNKWVGIILSNKFEENDIPNRLSEMLTEFSSTPEPSQDVRYEVAYRLLNTNSCPMRLKDLLKQRYSKEFTFDQYNETKLKDIVVLFDHAQIYEYWLRTIISKVADANFNVGNRAINLFRYIEKDHWISKVSVETKVDFVKNLLFEGRYESYHSHNAEELMHNLPNEYPELVKEFLSYVFLPENNEYKDEDFNLYLNGNYFDVVVTYIQSEPDLMRKIVETINSNDFKDVNKEVVIHKIRQE